MKKLWQWIVADRSKAQLIFVGACILSYMHTLNLFERSGYEGILAHIGTIICELLFLLGITSKTPNRRTRGALFFGGAIVLYSNVSYGLANGKAIVFYTFQNGMKLSEVILCGILIPALVWTAEWVRAYKAENTQPTASEGENAQPEPTTQEEPPTIAQAEENAQATEEPPTDPEAAHPEESPKAEIPAREEAAEPIAQAEKVAQREESPKQAEENTQPAERPKRKTKTAGRKDSAEYAEIERVARQWLAEKGELPSRRELMAAAGCKEYRARVTLERLAEELEELKETAQQHQPGNTHPEQIAQEENSHPDPEDTWAEVAQQEESPKTETPTWEEDSCPEPIAQEGTPTQEGEAEPIAREELKTA